MTTKLKLLQRAFTCTFLALVINISVLPLPIFHGLCQTNSFFITVTLTGSKQKAYAFDTEENTGNNNNEEEDSNENDNHNHESDSHNDDDNDNHDKNHPHRKPRCNDGIDNDGDGAVDFPSDFSCSSAKDKDEFFPKAGCQDGKDNDKDGFVDFPNDPGCNSNQDNDEFNLTASSSSGNNSSSTTSSSSSTSGNNSSSTTSSSSSTSGNNSSSTTSSSSSSSGNNNSSTTSSSSSSSGNNSSSTTSSSSSSSGNNNSSTTSSSSSSSGNNNSSTTSTTSGINTFCPDPQTLCSPNANLSCSDISYSIVCLNNTLNCCKTINSSLSCEPSFLTCKSVSTSSSSSGAISSSSSSGTSSAFLTVDVINTPKLPDITPLPLIPDEFIGKIGFAYFGSSPSFEIQIPENKTNLKIISVDLKDKRGIFFADIPFTITKVPNNPDILILGLTLPDNLSTGEANFILNLDNSETLTGTIQIIEFLDIQIPISLSTTKNISKPLISRIRTKVINKKLTVFLRGNNFVKRGIFLQQDDRRNFILNPLHDPHTTITVYPSNLNITLEKRVVTRNGRRMKIKLKMPKKIGQTTNAVLVIATPRGIVSQHFQIRK